MTPFGITVLEKHNPKRRVSMLLGDTAPTPSAGGGTWAQMPMPKRSAVTVWAGRDSLLLMDVHVVVGNAAAQQAISSDIDKLTAMWRPANPTIEPPVLTVYCDTDALPYRKLSWVLNDFQWNEAVARPDGVKVQQRLMLQFLEYRADERLQVLKVKKPPPFWQRKTYTVRKGDTLQGIATRLKIKGGWRRLGEAQDPVITDPRHIRVGEKLLIPLPTDEFTTDRLRQAGG